MLLSPLTGVAVVVVAVIKPCRSAYSPQDEYYY